MCGDSGGPGALLGLGGVRGTGYAPWECCALLDSNSGRNPLLSRSESWPTFPGLHWQRESQVLKGRPGPPVVLAHNSPDTRTRRLRARGGEHGNGEVRYQVCIRKNP